jgi:FkbM family methyltransferase
MKTINKDDVVVDVGANAGYFSLLSASLTGKNGKVLAVEANPSNVDQIKASLALNPDFPVVIENLAASDTAGPVLFGTGGEEDSNGGIMDGRKPEHAGKFVFEVMALPLSDILERNGIDRIKLIKIDTEGHELNVIKSFSGFLERGLVDFIVCELNIPGLGRRGITPPQLFDFVNKFGYGTFLFDNDGGLPKFVPHGVDIVQQWTCNILFAKMDSLSRYWPTVTNIPASVRISS